MPSCSKLYKDKEKLKQYLERNKSHYYNKTKNQCVNGGKSWTDEEIYLILYSPLTDTELSKILHRSIMSIQIKRSRVIKLLK